MSANFDQDGLDDFLSNIDSVSPPLPAPNPLPGQCPDQKDRIRRLRPEHRFRRGAARAQQRPHQASEKGARVPRPPRQDSPRQPRYAPTPPLSLTPPLRQRPKRDLRPLVPQMLSGIHLTLPQMLPLWSRLYHLPRTKKRARFTGRCLQSDKRP